MMQYARAPYRFLDIEGKSVGIALDGNNQWHFYRLSINGAEYSVGFETGYDPLVPLKERHIVFIYLNNMKCLNGEGDITQEVRSLAQAAIKQQLLNESEAGRVNYVIRFQ